MRLVMAVAAADGSAKYGRLEVFHRGGWGTVCADSTPNRFVQRDSDVVCRQLGFQEGFQIQALVCCICSMSSVIICHTLILCQMCIAALVSHGNEASSIPHK